jgi:membrane protein DedA with SNARE-associated domain
VIFERWGIWVVLLGRFSALLRMFTGPFAGVFQVPHRRFEMASIAGAVLWAGVTTGVVYVLGDLAGPWLDQISLAGLALFATFLVVSVVQTVRSNRRAAP